MTVWKHKANVGSAYMVDVDVRTPKGRVDMVLRTATHLYLFELKLGKSAGAAMRQIGLKEYPKRFALCGLPIVKVGRPPRGGRRLVCKSHHHKDALGKHFVFENLESFPKPKCKRLLMSGLTYINTRKVIQFVIFTNKRFTFAVAIEETSISVDSIKYENHKLSNREEHDTDSCETRRKSRGV